MKRSKKKTGLIILIVLLFLLLAGAGVFCFYYFNRPILKINKAIEEDNIEEVADLYGSLSKESEMLDVQDLMLDRCKDLEEGFVNEKYEYDFVQEQFDILGEEILEDNSRFNKIVKNINILNNSRNAYDAGIEAFEKEDYETAIEEFSKVIKDDGNFENAQSKIEECKALMKPDVTGVYRAKIDVADIIMSYMGVAGGSSPLPLTIDFVIEITDDVNGSAYVDLKDPDAMIETVIKIVTALTKKKIADEYGVSEANLDSYLKILMGKSVEEMIRDEVNIDELKKMIPLEKTPFTYTVEEDVVHADYEGSTGGFNLYIHDEGLYLEEDSKNEMGEFSSMGLEFPLIFYKE
ncbi:MAG: hypothetical protein K5888_04380 [Lachnospiraceae bacterium]|nr:hypothetical protein [Lachnospiraceae bacterium]